LGGWLLATPPRQVVVKRVIASFTAITLIFLCALPALAQGLGISPPSVEFDVPANGKTEVEFLVYDFTGNLEISLEDIPLRVEPTTVPVTAKEEGTTVVLTFYGDESVGSQVFNGKIRFLAMTGGTVAMGIKVKATINHMAGGELPQTTPQESPPPAPPGPPPATSGATEWPIIPLAGIAAGTAIVLTLIVVVARRRRY
jgi:hypothetical protein